jgi:hypothetical protein
MVVACLRSAGMGIDDMRAYLDGVAEGRTAAPRMVALLPLTPGAWSENWPRRTALGGVRKDGCGREVFTGYVT